MKVRGLSVLGGAAAIAIACGQNGDESAREAPREAAMVLVESPVSVARGMVVYPKAFVGADVVHRVHTEGTENYVVFAARPAREEIVYDVDVTEAAGLRLISTTTPPRRGSRRPSNARRTSARADARQPAPRSMTASRRTCAARMGSAPQRARPTPAAATLPVVTRLAVASR